MLSVDMFNFGLVESGSLLISRFEKVSISHKMLVQKQRNKLVHNKVISLCPFNIPQYLNFNQLISLHRQFLFVK